MINTISQECVLSSCSSLGNRNSIENLFVLQKNLNDLNQKSYTNLALNFLITNVESNSDISCPSNSCSNSILQNYYLSLFNLYSRAISNDLGVKFPYRNFNEGFINQKTYFNYLYFGGFKNVSIYYDYDELRIINFSLINFSLNNSSKFSINESISGSYQVFFNFTLFDNSSYRFPPIGNYSLVLRIPDLEKDKLFEISKLGFRDPSFFCDPLGSINNRQNDSCSYEQFQMPLIKSLFLIEKTDIFNGTNSSNLLQEIDVFDSFASCDFADGDFKCEDFSDESPQGTQTNAVSSQRRYNEMLSSLYYNQIGTNRTDLSSNYLLNYFYNFELTCFDQLGNNLCSYENSRYDLESLFYSSLIYPSQEKIELVTNILNNYNYSNISDYERTIPLIRFSNNESHKEQILSNFTLIKDYCIFNNCSEQEKISNLYSLSYALRNSNEPIYDISLRNNFAIPRLDPNKDLTNECDFESFYQLSADNLSNYTSSPLDSNLRCNFPNQMGDYSSLYSWLYYEGFFSSTQRKFNISCNPSSSNVTYLDTMTVDCSIYNFNNFTISDVFISQVSQLDYLSILNVSNNATPLTVNSSIVNSNTIFIEDFYNKTTINVTWLINITDIGEIVFTTNAGDSGQNTSTVSFSNISIGNLSIVLLEENLVQNQNYNLLEIEYLDNDVFVENPQFNINSDLDFDIDSISLRRNIDNVSFQTLPFSLVNNTIFVQTLFFPDDDITLSIFANIDSLISENFGVNLTGEYGVFSSSVETQNVTVIESDNINLTLRSIGGDIPIGQNTNQLELIVSNSASLGNLSYNFTDFEVQMVLPSGVSISSTSQNGTSFVEVSPTRYQISNFEFSNTTTFIFNMTYDSQSVFDIRIDANSGNGFSSSDTLRIRRDLPTGSGGGGSGGSSGGGSSGGSSRSNQPEQELCEFENSFTQTSRTFYTDRILNYVEFLKENNSNTYETLIFSVTDSINCVEVEEYYFNGSLEVTITNRCLDLEYENVYLSIDDKIRNYSINSNLTKNILSIDYNQGNACDDSSKIDFVLLYSQEDLVEDILLDDGDKTIKELDLSILESIKNKTENFYNLTLNYFLNSSQDSFLESTSSPILNNIQDIFYRDNKLNLSVVIVVLLLLILVFIFWIWFIFRNLEKRIFFALHRIEIQSYENKNDAIVEYNKLINGSQYKFIKLFSKDFEKSVIYEETLELKSKLF